MRDETLIEQEIFDPEWADLTHLVMEWNRRRRVREPQRGYRGLLDSMGRRLDGGLSTMIMGSIRRPGMAGFTRSVAISSTFPSMGTPMVAAPPR
jgi:hypothetical protein